MTNIQPVFQFCFFYKFNQNFNNSTIVSQSQNPIPPSQFPIRFNLFHIATDQLSSFISRFACAPQSELCNNFSCSTPRRLSSYNTQNYNSFMKSLFKRGEKARFRISSKQFTLDRALEIVGKPQAYIHFKLAFVSEAENSYNIHSLTWLGFIHESEAD